MDKERLLEIIVIHNKLGNSKVRKKYGKKLVLGYRRTTMKGKINEVVIKRDKDSYS